MSKLKVIEKLESENYVFIKYEGHENYWSIYDKNSKKIDYNYRIQKKEGDCILMISQDIEPSYEKYVELCNEFNKEYSKKVDFIDRTLSESEFNRITSKK